MKKALLIFFFFSILAFFKNEAFANHLRPPYQACGHNKLEGHFYSNNRGNIVWQVGWRVIYNFRQGNQFANGTTWKVLVNSSSCPEGTLCGWEDVKTLANNDALQPYGVQWGTGCIDPFVPAAQFDGTRSCNDYFLFPAQNVTMSRSNLDRLNAGGSSYNYLDDISWYEDNGGATIYFSGFHDTSSCPSKPCQPNFSSCGTNRCGSRYWNGCRYVDCNGCPAGETCTDPNGQGSCVQRYGCNPDTGRCEKRASGAYTNENTCNNNCVQTRYGCNPDTGRCEARASGAYTNVNTCNNNCTQRRYGCNPDTGRCEERASGAYTNVNTCNNNCVQTRYGCNTDTGRCEVRASGAYTNVNTCNNNCVQNRPDLVVAAFSFPGGVCSTTANASVTVRNIGNDATRSVFNVRLRNGAGSTEIVTTAGLSAGESRNLTIPIARPPSAGPAYVADVMVDSATPDNVDESNENNNTATSTYAVTCQPDLVITSFSVQDGVINGTGVARVTVRNSGVQPVTGNFQVSVRNSSPTGTTFTATTGPMSVGESRVVPVTITRPGVPGTPTAFATVDSGGNITESNETNNTATDVYTVTAPDLRITGFSVPNGICAESVNARVTIINGGNETTGVGFAVRASVPGSSNDASTVALTAGGSRTVSVPITLPSTEGTHNGTASVDVGGAVTESNEGNNSAGTTFSVTCFSISGGLFMDDDYDGTRNGESYIPLAGGENITISGPGTNTNAASPFTLAGRSPGDYAITYNNMRQGYVSTTHPIIPRTYLITLGPGCVNRGLSRCDGSGNVSGVDFGINLPGEPWIQGAGGDMRSDQGFTVFVPGSQQFSITQGLLSSPGVVFNFDVNRTPWIVRNTPFAGKVAKTSYTYISAVLRDNRTSQLPMFGAGRPCGNANGPNCNLRNSAAGYYSNTGNVRFIGADYTFRGGGDYIFIVNGNITIEANIFVAQGTTATFIASGDITVGAQATNIDGVFSADGDFIVENSPTSSQLTINGSVIGNAVRNGGNTNPFINRRDLGHRTNNSSPAVLVIYRPDFVLNAPDIIKTPNFSFQEIAPQGR